MFQRIPASEKATDKSIGFVYEKNIQERMGKILLLKSDHLPSCAEVFVSLALWFNTNQLRNCTAEHFLTTPVSHLRGSM